MNAEVIAPMIVVTTLILTVGLTAVLRGPLGKALAERLAGRRAAPLEDADLTLVYSAPIGRCNITIYLY